MPRQTVIGNGNMLICLDENGEVRDLYYPHAGLENHVVGRTHRLGISINNEFYWFKDFNKYNSQSANTLKSTNIFTKPEEKIEVEFENIIYNEREIFVRKISIRNKDTYDKDIKLFFGQEFQIKENKYRNTGFYYPPKNVVIHYRGRRVFLVNILSNKKGIDDYTVGLYGYDNKEGSYTTAEKIDLPKNAVEHGPVDSVVAKNVKVKAGKTRTVYYFLIAGKTVDEVLQTNDFVLSKKPPHHMFNTTSNYWDAWRNKRPFNFVSLSKEAVKLFYRSLFVVRSHIDEKGGGVIASGDSTMYSFGKDSYAYVWARDGAYSSKALSHIGYFNLSRKIINFFAETISDKGFMLHKFEVDKSLGSSWHPWINEGKFKLPIQEDETAILINALWEYYQITKDIEFVEKNYDRLIKNPADFMCNYIDKALNLPQNSYDLWEENFRVYTYTTCTVIDALKKAADFSIILGKKIRGKRYQDMADNIQEGLMEHLYNKADGTFYKSVTVENGTITNKDKTADASTLYALWYFNVLSADSDIFIKYEKHVVPILRQSDGSFIRYEDDKYFKKGEAQSNPWIITTLWYLQLKIKRTTSFEQLKSVAREIDNLLILQTDSGVLPEQVDYLTRTEVSATPLTWSHACYIETIAMYLRKLDQFGIGETYLPK
ncbi:hypothetical protein COV24_03750 [candidate division WWE3 bacterium CG10_big_fil_rev_8_21_14_0_10_32_10]|uniref:GH15-like domain-containing protein n=1 Tax=candidate division WWE3 bacterium CG10_big_fil_rev_8_21_14_0_10_32_10 TaxID=1975090 RepID=A0A2H0R9Q0_UNCKA|nr:MAG: hypothetical protein COV24_03750 [candidate division WWE3 bacterium CG10_big_fil_rev_8_21_14_0_10_32_10]